LQTAAGPGNGGGVQADLTYVEGAGHASVLKTPEFIKVARQMARKLQRGAGLGQGDDDGTAHMQNARLVGAGADCVGWGL